MEQGLTLAAGAVNALPSPADRDMLIVSGVLNEADYRRRAALPLDADPATHYLTTGWLDDLNPSDGFDAAFLRPFYEAASRHGPPAITWLDLSLLPGRAPPRNAEEAAYLADRIRGHRFFDAAAYAARLPPGLDPATHYAVIGELLGWLPSPRLDPTFYLERHPDVARLCLSPLDHFIESGAAEGRSGASAADRLVLPPTPGSRPVVLVILHEASRSGAPMLGLNIAQRLATSVDVVAVMLRGGALAPHLAATCAAVVGPPGIGDDHEAEMERLATRLVERYDPLYAIANSAETAVIVPALGRRGVPIVALVHEFPAYLRPAAKLRHVLDWAIHVVFPADIVAQAAFRAYPSAACRRGIHVMPQGRVELPFQSATRTLPAPDFTDPAGKFVVLGLGTVHLRKGVDLFIAAAAILLRIAPDRRFRFVWIGGGYDPAADSDYSAYLAAQIIQSGLEDRLTLLDEVADLRPAYDAADLFFLSSRLDPQPNVAIEAVLRGLPTICFAGASGTADILAADPATRPLVVPHLDAHAAAQQILRLAADPAAMQHMRAATARVGAAGYDMDAYLTAIDRWGRSAAASLHTDDLLTLSEPRVIDAELAVSPHAPGPAPSPARQVLQQWAVVGQSRGQHDNQHFRRPCPGFHPQAYAEAHPVCIDQGINPLAHWLRSGRCQGDWFHPVFTSLGAEPPAPAMRIALHVHLQNAILAADLRARLAANAIRCDLFITTETDTDAARLVDQLGGHTRSLSVTRRPQTHSALQAFIEVMRHQPPDHDIVGHIHDAGPPTPHDLSRHLQWESLVGDAAPMLDHAAAVLSAHPQIGLLMAETPYLRGWDTHRPAAALLADQLGTPLAPGEFLDFPLNGMVWARPAALRPLMSLDLNWDQPSMQQTLERLLPHAARSAGYSLASLRATGTTC